MEEELIRIPRNPPDCFILDNWVLDSLTSFDIFFAKALQRLPTCLLVKNSSCGKLVLSSELPISFDDNFKTVSVYFYCRLSFIKLWIW